MSADKQPCVGIKRILCSDATISTVNKFYHFSALPVELRLTIWSIALSIPRNVDIICDTDIQLPGSFYRPSHGPPALLHVCQESRSEALKIYKPLFQNEFAPVYAAFSQDTIRAPQGFLDLGGDKLQRIQQMEINIQDNKRFALRGITTLMKMTNLRKLELVCEQGVIYTQYWYPKTVMDDIHSDIAHGWDCPPSIKIVDGRNGETLQLGVEGEQPLTIIPTTLGINYSRGDTLTMQAYAGFIEPRTQYV